MHKRPIANPKRGGLTAPAPPRENQEGHKQDPKDHFTSYGVGSDQEGHHSCGEGRRKHPQQGSRNTSEPRPAALQAASDDSQHAYGVVSPTPWLEHPPRRLEVRCPATHTADPGSTPTRGSICRRTPIQPRRSDASWGFLAQWSPTNRPKSLHRRTRLRRRKAFAGFAASDLPLGFSNTAVGCGAWVAGRVWTPFCGYLRLSCYWPLWASCSVVPRRDRTRSATSFVPVSVWLTGAEAARSGA